MKGKVVFKKGFEERLIRLKKAIEYYFETGNISDVLPALYSCFTCCYCHSPIKLIKDNAKGN